MTGKCQDIPLACFIYMYKCVQTLHSCDISYPTLTKRDADAITTKRKQTKKTRG